MLLISCPLCASHDFKTLLRSKDLLQRVDETLFTLVRCRSCGLVFLNPQPTWRELKRYYPNDYVSHKRTRDSSVVHPSLTKKLIGFLSRYKQRWMPTPMPKWFEKEEGRYLDVGCGNGHLLQSLQSRRPHWDYYGVEPVLGAAQAAREKGFKVKTMMLREARFPSGWFDVVSLNHVLEHVPDPSETLQEVHRILKPGGTLILMVPNHRSVGARLFKKYWYPLDIPRHLFQFTPKTLIAFIEKAGFTSPHFVFDKNPKHLLKSWHMKCNHPDPASDQFNPILWWGLKPLTHLIGLLRLGDVLKLEVISSLPSQKE